MSTHSPGPWTVTRVSKSTILKDIYISASTERIARVCVPATAQNIAEYEANAFLIAAAPALLKALKKCAAVCAGENTTKRALIEALEEARAALTQAKGGAA